MQKNLINKYFEFKRTGNAHIVGKSASCALSAARTAIKFESMGGDVRIAAEAEIDGYFDVFGEPDCERERARIVDLLENWGCWYVYSEYRDPASGNWVSADGIGMCVYENPTSELENCYVIDLMDSAIDALEAARLHWVAGG
jgi:hypothetical protein